MNINELNGIKHDTEVVITGNVLYQGTLPKLEVNFRQSNGNPVHHVYPKIRLVELDDSTGCIELYIPDFLKTEVTNGKTLVVKGWLQFYHTSKKPYVVAYEVGDQCS